MPSENALWEDKDYCERLLIGPATYKTREWQDMQSGAARALEALGNGHRDAGIRLVARSMGTKTEPASEIAQRITEMLKPQP